MVNHPGLLPENPMAEETGSGCNVRVVRNWTQLKQFSMPTHKESQKKVGLEFLVAGQCALGLRRPLPEQWDRVLNPGAQETEHRVGLRPLIQPWSLCTVS